MKASLCSQNAHKLEELRRVLPGWEIELLAAHEFPQEEGLTYYENARAKARFGRTVGASDVWMLGEDSGIEVDGLGGRPGIESARWAADGVARLLEELRGREDEARRARYVCELVCISPALEEHRGTGILEGRVGGGPRGSEGFGYDPVFVPDGEERTVAELGDAWKAQNSHRARAAQGLLEAMNALTRQ